jgi:hypothetical protein
MGHDVTVKTEKGGRKKLFEIKRPGEFTRKAKSHGMTVPKFAGHVLANKENFPTKTIRQASSAKGLRAMSKSKS